MADELGFEHIHLAFMDSDQKISEVIDKPQDVKDLGNVILKAGSIDKQIAALLKELDLAFEDF